MRPHILSCLSRRTSNSYAYFHTDPTTINQWQYLSRTWPHLKHSGPASLLCSCTEPNFVFLWTLRQLCDPIMLNGQLISIIHNYIFNQTEKNLFSWSSISVELQFLPDEVGILFHLLLVLLQVTSWLQASKPVLKKLSRNSPNQVLSLMWLAFSRSQ